MKAETCGACQAEIRFGVRGRVTGWLHREDVDHDAILGRPFTDADKAEVERQLDLPRTRRVMKDGVEVEETYTVRELDLERYRKSAKFREREAAERDEEDDDEPVAPLPPIEAHAQDVDPATFAPRSGIRQVINLIGKTPGWELVNVHHARGPYLGAKGQCLSISDTHVVRARAVELDGSVRIAVGSWRDGSFDFAFIGTIRGGRIVASELNPTALKVNAAMMKNWIKGTA